MVCNANFTKKPSIEVLLNGISIVVVTWNCAQFINRFLQELSASLCELDAFEVLLLDNASSDGTAELIQKNLPENFHFICSNENLGFARGNNVLLRQVRYNTIALLNPDVFDFPQGFWTKVDASRVREGADAAFVKLRNADGSFQDCVGAFPTPRRALASLLGSHIEWSQVSQPTRVEVGIMAFQIMTRKCLDSVGLIDEDFHMYCEDVEWCWRAAKAGKILVYLPELSLTHIGGASAESRWKGLRKELIKVRSEALFVRKHFYGQRLWVMLGLNLLKRALLHVRILAT